MGPRSISIKYPCHLNLDLILSVVIKEQCLSAPLPLVIARADADRVDIPPISLNLWMKGGVPVNLAGGRLQDLGFETFGQSEHVDGPKHACFGRLDRVPLIVDRG